MSETLSRLQKSGLRDEVLGIQRTRSEFAAKSRAHAETIASLRQGHSDAAKTMEAESRAKQQEQLAEQQERQREAEERRKEPLSTGGLCATAGSVAQLTAEVRAFPSRRLMPFQLRSSNVLSASRDRLRVCVRAYAAFARSWRCASTRTTAQARACAARRAGRAATLS